MIILHAWGGRLGEWCAVQASVSGVCECAIVVLVMHYSLRSRLSGAADDL